MHYHILRPKSHDRQFILETPTMNDSYNTYKASYVNMPKLILLTSRFSVIVQFK